MGVKAALQLLSVPTLTSLGRCALPLCSYVAVITNCALIALATDNLGSYLPSLDLAARVMVLVVLEHVLVAAKLLLDNVIPDVPADVRLAVRGCCGGGGGGGVAFVVRQLTHRRTNSCNSFRTATRTTRTHSSRKCRRAREAMAVPALRRWLARSWAEVLVTVPAAIAVTVTQTTAQHRLRWCRQRRRLPAAACGIGLGAVEKQWA